MLRTGRKALLGMTIIVAGTALAVAQSLDVPVMVTANDDLDTCAVGEVYGLNPDGDNFLAVRAGARHRSRDDRQNSHRRSGLDVFRTRQVGRRRLRL